MEKGKDIKIRIDKYIKDELNGDSLIAFEDQLKADKNLQNDVRWHKQIHETLRASKGYKKQDDEMHAYLNQMANEFILQETPSKEKNFEHKLEYGENVHTIETTQKGSIIRWLIPAAALAAAAVVLFMLFPFGQTDLPTYANNYYQPYEASFTVRGEANDLSKAGKLYEEKNYNAALAIFNNYPNNLKAQITKGNCEYQLGQFDEAIITFKKMADTNSFYAESASWFLGLSYLQKDNKAEAIHYFKKVGKGSAYSKQANQLLNKIGN